MGYSELGGPSPLYAVDDIHVRDCRFPWCSRTSGRFFGLVVVVFYSLAFVSPHANCGTESRKEFFLHSRYGDVISDQNYIFYSISFPHRFGLRVTKSWADLRGLFLLPWVFLSGLLFLFSSTRRENFIEFILLRVFLVARFWTFLWVQTS